MSGHLKARLKHIVFDLGAVLFSWQPRQMLMREVPHLAPDDVAAAQALGWCALQFHGAARAASDLHTRGWIGRG